MGATQRIRMCGAQPYNSGLNKLVERRRVIWSFDGATRGCRLVSTPSGSGVCTKPLLDFSRMTWVDWVAEFACGHTQHVRPQPSWINWLWVITSAGCQQHLGQLLWCQHCEHHGRDAVAESSGAPEKMVDNERHGALPTRRQKLPLFEV
jgi:hypothetical protein